MDPEGGTQSLLLRHSIDCKVIPFDSLSASKVKPLEFQFSGRNHLHFLNLLDYKVGVEESYQ